jgi:hypothetical protein
MPIVNSDDCHLCADGKICKIRGDIPKMHEVALPDGRCQIYKPIAEVPQKGPLFIGRLTLHLFYQRYILRSAFHE